jgi:hypothetical protein
MSINHLNAELNPICHLLALLGAHHILHVSRIRVNFVSENRAVYDLTWRNTIQVTEYNITWRMRFAWWITKATNTHLEYVILIAFPRQRLLYERT